MASGRPENHAIVALANAAKQPLFPPHLTKLYLSHCYIRRGGLVALLEAASTPGVFSSLRKLDLSFNYIRTGLDLFGTALFPALKLLNLEQNFVDDDSLILFVIAVAPSAKLTALMRLGLGGNKYRTRGLTALTGAINGGAMPALKHITSIVQRGDHGYDECERGAVERLKEAMLARRMFPRQRLLSRKWTSTPWILLTRELGAVRHRGLGLGRVGLGVVGPRGPGVQFRRCVRQCVARERRELTRATTAASRRSSR